MTEEIEGGITESHARTVFRHSFMTLGARIAIVLINIPTSILVARLLGTEGQGAYVSAIVFPTIFAFIGLLGIDASHTFLLSKRRHSVAQINGQSLLLVVVLSCLITPLYLIFLRFYRGAADPDLRVILNLAALLIPVLLAKYLSVALLLGLQRIRWFNIGNLIQAAVLLVLMCVNLFIVHGGARGALIAYLASEVTVSLIALRVARRAVGAGRLFERPPPGLFKTSAKYGLAGHIGNVLVQFTFRFDMFVILSIVGLATQGLYSIAVILAEKLNHIPQSVQVVLFPKLSSLTTEEANELTPRVARNSFLATAVAGAALYLLSRPLLTLFYGREYLPALKAFQILIPGVVMLSVSTILSGDFSGRDKRIYQTVANGIAFAVNVALCFLWIPRWGIVGAAWASTVAYSLQTVIMLALFRILSGRGILETLIIRSDDVALYVSLVRKLLGRARTGS